MNTETINIQKNNIPKLGEGIFLVTDVAEILNLPLPKVRRWLLQFWDKNFGQEAGLYSFGEERNRAVNFYTLIEFYTFYQLKNKGLSTQKIQKFHRQISKELKTKYPFAHSELSTDGKAVWYKHLENIIKADGKKQIDLVHILKPFLHKIEFGKNKIAEKYYPLEKSKNVVVDPKHQFGQPTISGTNIKTKTIYNLYRSGEPNENICNLYDISLKKVKDAVCFHQKVA